MKKLKLNTENILLGISIVLICAFCSLYYFLQSTVLQNFAAYISGVSTVGIFVLTAFYVVYTNRQLKEIQKQRQLNIQPLPNVNIKHGIILSPRILVAIPDGGKVSLGVDFKFKTEIKNIGNGAAVEVDTISKFFGKKVKSEKEINSSRRYAVLEEKELVKADFQLRDDGFDIITLLNTAIKGACARSKVFDSMLNYTVVYRNILGAAFVHSTNYVLLINDKGKRELSEWLGHVNSFQQKYSTEIEKFQAMFSRDRKEAMSYLNEIKEDFYSKCVPGAIDIFIRIIPNSFKVKNIDENDYESLMKQIRHSVPVRPRRYEEDEINEFTEWRDENINRFFGDFINKKNNSTKDEIN